jgi:hypothetical protein
LSSAAFGYGSTWLAKFCELADAHDTTWHDGTDFKFAAHSLDDFPKRADEHVRTPFDFGDGGLSDVQNVSQLFLSQVQGSGKLRFRQ